MTVTAVPRESQTRCNTTAVVAISLLQKRKLPDFKCFVLLQQQLDREGIGLHWIGRTPRIVL